MLLKWVVSKLSARVTPPSLALATTEGPFLPYRCSVAFW